MNKPDVWRNPVHFLAFGFGSGLAPVAPGTFGTLAAIPPYLLLVQCSMATYVAVLLAGTLLGFYLCGRTSADMGVHDHGGIVWDEIIGYWLTMLAMPPTWYWIIAGFLLFRLFDIWKPWPVRLADQHVHGGVGIMLDDLIAGVYALAALHGLRLLVGTFG